MAMLWYGLTGGIATGKSTVGKMMRDEGVPVIDADELAHQALGRDSVIYPEVIKAFGREILAPDRSIDRRRLGSLVFSSRDKLTRLEQLVHPTVKALAAGLRRNYEAQGFPFAVYDVPLLFEKNMQNEFDGVILVYAKEDVQRQRLRKRNDLTPKEIDDRIRSQIPIDQKRALAGYLIDNQAGLETTRRRVKDLLVELKQKAQKPHE